MAGTYRCRADLPLASAKPATTRRVQAQLGHAPDATGSYWVLDVSGASITEWRTAQGGFLTRPRSPAGR